MDKKEALKLLERYTNALKAKAEAEDGLGRIDSAFKVDASAFDVPFVKNLTPILGVFLVIALAFRIAFAGRLNYKNEVPVTIGMFAGAAVIGFVIAKLVHLLTQKKARKKLEALRSLNLMAKESKINEYKTAISKAGYKIALAESAIPAACRGIRVRSRESYAYRAREAPVPAISPTAILLPPAVVSSSAVPGELYSR